MVWAIRGNVQNSAVREGGNREAHGEMKNGEGVKIGRERGGVNRRVESDWMIGQGRWAFGGGGLRLVGNWWGEARGDGRNSGGRQVEFGEEKGGDQLGDGVTSTGCRKGDGGATGCAW